MAQLWMAQICRRSAVESCEQSDLQGHVVWGLKLLGFSWLIVHSSGFPGTF